MPYQPKQKKKPIYDENSGVEPTQDQIDRMVKQARNVILYWLSRGDQPRANLFKKVRAKGIPEDIINGVLNQFEDMDFINDERFAKYFIDSKLKYDKLAKWGIAQKLREKGIDKEIIEETLSEVDETLIEDNAYALVRKRLASSKKYEPQKRLKNLADMLIRKGYGVGQAFQIVKDVLKEEQEDLQLDDEQDWE